MTAQRATGAELYLVSSINGHSPLGLDEFTEQATITLAREELNYQISGAGTVTTTGEVQFRQTAPLRDDRGRATWLITDGGGGAFYAEPVDAW